MITVLHIIEKLGAFGGTATKLLTLARHSGELVRHRFLTMTPGDSDEKFRALGCDVVTCDTVRPSVLLRKYLRELGRERPDLACTHFRRPLLVGGLAARLVGVPFVHHEHGPADASDVALTLSARIRRLWKRHALRCAAGIVANSFFTARTIADAFGPALPRMEVLHNPVECRRAGGWPPDATRRKSGIHVGHVGGMIAVRDQETLIEAIHLARKAGVDAQLTIVGDGPRRPTLESLIERRRMRDAVHLLGYRSDIGDLLTSFDVFVNATRSEGFGIAVVEAMLAEIPVVVAASGAHPEIIEDGRTGFLFPPGEVEALARVLIRLHESPGLRSSVGSAGAASAAERFDPAAVAARYATLLSSFLQ